MRDARLPHFSSGLDIDRLCMLPPGWESIRDVMLFPQLKPKQISEGGVDFHRHTGCP
jgi:hypothetical protein